MELIHSHPRPGAGRVKVQAPDLPVEITVQPGTEFRLVHVMADRGLRARAGSAGWGAGEMWVVVDRPGTLSFALGLLGIERGSTVAGGSVRSQGKGSVVAGGSITNSAIGRGARVVIDGHEVQPREPGVHLTVPLGCLFDIRAHDGITVHYNGTSMTIETAAGIGVLERA